MQSKILFDQCTLSLLEGPRSHCKFLENCLMSCRCRSISFSTWFESSNKDASSGRASSYYEIIVQLKQFSCSRSSSWHDHGSADSDADLSSIGMDVLLQEKKQNLQV